MSRRNTGRARVAGAVEDVWIDVPRNPTVVKSPAGPEVNHSSPSPSGYVDDDLSSRVFASVVALVEDRRQVTSAWQETRQLLMDAEHTVDELKEEQRHMQLLVEKKEDEIQAFRRQLADKQLKYDQLLEDYKQLRANDAVEYEKLQQQMKELRLGYENLNADYTRFRSESMKEVERLEAEIRGGVVRYHQLLDEFNKVRDENMSLMANVMNFTQQISGLRMPDKIKDDPRNQVPIRPVAETGTIE